jgi:hypothetical protein
VLKSGAYRINWWAIQHGGGSNGTAHSRLMVNGQQRSYTHKIGSGGGVWYTGYQDMVWRFVEGDTFWLEGYDNTAFDYAYHSWNSSGSHSRMQIRYLGD